MHQTVKIFDNGEWSAFPDQILGFLKQDLIEFTVDGKKVAGFRSPDSQCLWIRDHADMMRAGRYLITDIKSAIECFANAQHQNGRIYDNVTTIPETRTGERENWEKWVRVPVESDVEYRFVKAIYLAWQATGDLTWMRQMLDSAEKALNYTMNHPWRWDKNHQLVKRPYTIDTWDFDYTSGRAPWLNFDITDNTYWGIFHGDNSGFYEAALLLARMYRDAGSDRNAVRWIRIAHDLRQKANELLFNGRFYTHFYKLTEVSIGGVEESDQLSLSNPMAINRGMATHEITVAILKEYQQRKEKGETFAEWFSIDPPFPDGVFGDDRLVKGAYINGGIFPLAGGELALAALENGFEEYGIEILRQYKQMIEETGETYLWYFPDGTPSSVETSTSPDALPTDGWGSSAMLYAFVEGLCGIKDTGHCFKSVLLAPRWISAGQHEAHVNLVYPASSATFGYEFNYNERQKLIHLSIRGSESDVQLHLLIPPDRQLDYLEIDGNAMSGKEFEIQHSRYVDIDFTVTNHTEVVVHLQ